MNVLFFTYSLSRNAGGLFFSVRSLAQQLAKDGTPCTAIAPHDELTEADAGQWAPVPVASYPVLGPKSLGFSTRIKPLMGTPDIQHMNGIWMYHSRVNQQTAAARNVPYVISPRGMLDGWALQNSGWKKRISRQLYEEKHLHGAACLHALCESEARSMRAFGLENPICVIPNAVDLPALSPRQTTGAKKKRLLFLGRIHPKKGLAQLIDAFARLSDTERGQWSLVIAGWDQNHQRDLEQQTQQAGIAEHVEFIGPQFGEQKKQQLQSCDAFVLPSFSEGLPMSVLEAWSYARPAVITSACNLPEGRRHNAAIECEPNVQDLTQALRNLFALPEEERLAIGHNARRLVEQKFTWPIVAEQMAAVYRWLLDQADQPETVQTLHMPMRTKVTPTVDETRETPRRAA